MSKGTPEEKIIWADGGLLQRVEALEGRTGGLGSGVSVGGAVPGGLAPVAPTDLTLVSNVIVEDDMGIRWVEATISFTGDADEYEVEIKRTA